MVQITNDLVAAAFIIPTIAAPVIEAAGLLQGREPKFTSQELQELKIIQQHNVPRIFVHKQRRDLELREPFRFPRGALKHLRVGHAAAGAAGFAGTHRIAALNTQQQRDFDESELLSAREPEVHVYSSVLKHAGHAAGFTGAQQQRSFDDSEIDAREPAPFDFENIITDINKLSKKPIRARDDKIGDELD